MSEKDLKEYGKSLLDTISVIEQTGIVGLETSLEVDGKTNKIDIKKDI